MARVFNIYFSYKNAMHNAIVTVRTTPFFTEYTLNFDEEILQALPGNKIISTSADHFIFQHASAHEPNPLMKEILSAVSQHIHIPEV
jgi:hypothetical protein